MKWWQIAVFVVILLLLLMAGSRIIWIHAQRDFACDDAQEGIQNYTPPTLLDLAAKYNNTRLQSYIQYLHDNRTPGFAKFLRYLLHKSPREVQQELFQRLCSQLNESQNFASIDINALTDLQLSEKDTYECGGADKFEKFIGSMRRNNDDILLTYLWSHSHEQIQALLGLICNNLDLNYAENKVITSNMLATASRMLSTESEQLTGMSSMVSATATFAPEKDEEKKKAFINIAGYVSSSNIEGCGGDTDLLNTYLTTSVSTDDILQLDASISAYMASAYNPLIQSQYATDLNSTLSQYCKNSNPKWQDMAPASLQGWMLSKPTLSSRINLGCTPNLLQNYIDHYEDDIDDVTVYTKVELYKYMNNLGSSSAAADDGVTEKVKFLNWLCSVIQNGASSENVNTIFTALIQQKKSTFQLPTAAETSPSVVAAIQAVSQNMMTIVETDQSPAAQAAYKAQYDAVNAPIVAPKWKPKSQNPNPEISFVKVIPDSSFETINRDLKKCQLNSDIQKQVKKYITKYPTTNKVELTEKWCKVVEQNASLAKTTDVAEMYKYLKPAPVVAAEARRLLQLTDPNKLKPKMQITASTKYVLKGYVQRLNAYRNTVSFYPTQPGQIPGLPGLTQSMIDPKSGFQGINDANLKQLFQFYLNNQATTANNPDQYQGNPYYVIFVRDSVSKVCQAIHAVPFDAFNDMYSNEMIQSDSTIKTEEGMSVSVWVLSDVNKALFPK